VLGEFFTKEFVKSFNMRLNIRAPVKPLWNGEWPLEVGFRDGDTITGPLSGNRVFGEFQSNNKVVLMHGVEIKLINRLRPCAMQQSRSWDGNVVDEVDIIAIWCNPGVARSHMQGACGRQAKLMCLKKLSPEARAATARKSRS
jgi:hypothetical protein